MLDPRLSIPLVVAALALTACDGGNGRTEWHTMDDAMWRYGDTVVYNAGCDSLGWSRIAVTVRHSDAYDYANIWLEMSYDTDDTTVCDTLNIHLADEFGRWYGSGSGVIISRTDTVAPSHMPDAASPVRLRHIMRVDTLAGIEQVGISYLK